MDLCVETCRAAGGFAELIGLLLLLGRWLWAEHNRRKLAVQTVNLSVEKASLEGQVRQLSLQPPALARGPSLQDLAIEITNSAESETPPNQVDVLTGTEDSARTTKVSRDP